MSSKPTHIHIRPVEIDIAGRGPKLAAVPLYSKTRRHPAKTKTVPAEGIKVPTSGAEGHYYKRRIADGVIEQFKPSKTKASKEA